MAVFSIADMASILPSAYPKLVGQVQRKAVLLRLLAAISGIKKNTTGESAKWSVKFGGQDAGAVDMDGGALRTAASDQPVAADLDFGSYAAPVKVTDDLMWRGGSAAGLADMNPLTDAIGQNIKDGIERWVKVANVDLYAGTGSSNLLVGLHKIVVATGIYANINASTYADWASTIAGNSGTLRSLTLGLIKTQLRTIAAASSQGRPDIAVCSPAIMDAVEALFEAYTRINYSPSDGMSGPGGAGERVSMNPPVITTAGGKINADGFRVFHWQNQRLWFVEDPDCVYTGATNPTNVMYLLNSADLEMRYLAPPGASQFDSDPKVIEAAEQSMGPLAGLQLELVKRGRTQYSHEFDISGKIALVAHSRNAHGCLMDIQ
jgi:hypothetical protein